MTTRVIYMYSIYGEHTVIKRKVLVSSGLLIKLYGYNKPMHYTRIFNGRKIEIFRIKIVIILLFLLKASRVLVRTASGIR